MGQTIPEKLWVQLTPSGGTISYVRDPRENEDNDRPTYVYSLAQPLARNKGALPSTTPDPFVLGLMIVCDACGSLMKGEYVLPEGGKQIVIAVDKCQCDSPLLR